MRKYNIFLTLFIISVIAGCLFIGFYLKAIFAVLVLKRDNPTPDPFEILTTMFTPAVIFSILIAAVTSLTSRIVGIVSVAKSKTVSDGEKVLWVLGFVFMNFITSIVFLIMAKGKNFVD
jgi:hypothetical protein